MAQRTPRHHIAIRRNILYGVARQVGNTLQIKFTVTPLQLDSLYWSTSDH